MNMGLEQELARLNPAKLYDYLQRRSQGLEKVSVCWHHWVLGHVLYRLHAGETRKVIVNAPPRSFKTTILLRTGLPWLLGQDPTAKIMVVTYNEDLAQSFAKDVAQVLRSEPYKRLFPKTRLKSESQSSMRVSTTANGSIFFTSFGATMTGVGADYIIFDDPIQASNIPFATRRDATEELIRYVATTRLNNPKTSRLLMIMQRMHPEDPTGRLLEMPDHGWEHLVLPAQFTETKTFVLSPFLPPKITAPDELLDPERLDEEVLRNARSSLGDAGFMAQYQQAPFYQDTQYRVVENLREVAPEEFEAKRSTAAVYHSWDTAYATHSNADYTALIKWAVVDDMAIVTEAQRFRRPTDEVQKAILLQMHADRPARIYVESAPHSDAMIAIINRTEGIPVRVTAVKSGGLSKEARLEKVLHHVNLGKVGMLRGAPGLPLLLQELWEFPTGRHDDLVDSFSMALAHIPFSSRQAVWRIS